VPLGGNVSRIDVPAGTRLVLKAKTDKPLELPGGIRLKGPLMNELEALPDAVRTKEMARLVSLRQTDAQGFVVEFPSVTRPIDLLLEFTDTDGVLGQRQVVIRPTEDMAPEADVQVEVVRKTSRGYLITPLCRIPVSGKIRDDHGLERVEYAYRYSLTQGPASSIASAGLSALQYPLGGPVPNLLSSAYLAFVVKFSQSQTPEKTAGKQPVVSFVRRLRETSEDVGMGEILQRLETKPQRPLLKDHVLDPNEDVFDVSQLSLKLSDDRQVQPHYGLGLWLTVTDNNIETGPGTGESKERFFFLVVSEDELLVEIAKEEESLHLKLEDTVNRLKESRSKLDQVVQELPRLKADEFSPMARRAEEVAESVTRGSDLTREVHTDYRRILRELEANQVQRGIINRVRNNICDPLEAVLGREYPAADDRLREFQRTLEERKADQNLANAARKSLDELIDRLSRVLDAMGDVTTINKLIAALVEIERGEQRESKRLQELRDSIQERILEGALEGPAKPEDKKP
jgi:hypothetical protein